MSGMTFMIEGAVPVEVSAIKLDTGELRFGLRVIEGAGEDIATGDPVPTHPLVDELFVIPKGETGGEPDGNVLTNDEPGQTIASVMNSAGESYVVTEDGSLVPGSEGGSLTVFPDGTFDFDAGPDFEFHHETETTDVSFTYTSDTGSSGNLVVTVEGSGAPEGDGGDDPVLPPIKDEGTTDPKLGDEIDPFGDPLPDPPTDDFILG